MTATLRSTDPVLDEFADLVGPSDPVTIEGGRTRWSIGGDVDTTARVVAAPKGIVDYAPAEMTVKVRAGTAVRVLHEELASRGQRTALPDRGGTVGGALAVGENDIGALGRGLIRTAPLQVRYVSAEGRIITSGGPTVKNVSGFDLPRLFVGSLGTLGFLAEVILRTNPIPPVSRWFAGRGVDAQVLLASLLAPSCVLTNGNLTWIQLEGHPADVDAEAQVLSALHVASSGSGDGTTSTSGDGTAFEEIDGPPDLPPHRRHSPKFLQSATNTVGNRSNYGEEIEVVGLGFGFAEEPQPVRELDPVLIALNAHVKANFDPTERLNPGRDAARK